MKLVAEYHLLNARMISIVVSSRNYGTCGMGHDDLMVSHSGC